MRNRPNLVFAAASPNWQCPRDLVFLPEKTASFVVLAALESPIFSIVFYIFEKDNVLTVVDIFLRFVADCSSRYTVNINN